MSLGLGKYDEALSCALRSCNALEGLLIVLDGPEGPGFSAHVSSESAQQIPAVLRSVADQMEQDDQEIQRIAKNQ